MHEVQALTFLVLPPPAATRTVWMFGSHLRRVRRCEWLTDMPKPGPLPQTSQVAATVKLLEKNGLVHIPAPLGNPNTIAAGITSLANAGGGPLLQVLDAAG